MKKDKTMEGLAHIFHVAPSKDIEYAYQSTPEARAEFQRRVDKGVDALLKAWKNSMKEQYSKKITKEKINITYIDTYNFDYYWWEEQYQNIYQVFAPTNKEVVDYYNRCINKDSAEFWNDLENCKYNEIPCIATGTMYITEKEKKLYIFPVTYPNIVKAIHECINNKSEYIIRQENQHIEVKVYHADGFSEYTIWLLNKQGIRAYEKILNGNGHASLALPCYHKKLTECLLDAYN